VDTINGCDVLFAWPMTSLLSPRGDPFVSVVQELFETEYDFPEFDRPPTREIMVAALPRSGSTAFALALWETGHLGSPLEYLNFELVSRFPRWAGELADPPRYWEHVQRVRTAPNGVFSFKMFPQNYRSLAADCPALLERICPTHVVYLTRKDLDRQSISYSRAIQSGAWFGDAAAVRSAVYNEKHISTCKKLLIRQMQDWERIFAITETNVLRMTYEEFEEDKSLAINSVAEFIGEDVSCKSMQLPQTKIQRNAETEVWIRRYQDSEEYLPNSLPPVRDDALIFPSESMSPPKVQIKDSLSPRGRGVYAGQHFALGDLVECAPVIIVQQALLPKTIARYMFDWQESATGETQRAVALGYGSLYNHADSPNMSFHLDPEQQAIRFIAKDNIQCGSELTINYNVSSGDQGDMPDLWFMANQIVKW
jgi:LPS sulfotransferase NodH